MTANFINNSATNIHTYIVNTSWAGNVASGNIPRASSRTVSISSGFLGNNAFGYVYIGKYGPNGGLLGQADISFYTGYPDPPFFPPFFPTFIPAPSFSDELAGNGRINLAYSDGVLANDATGYSIDSGSLPTGLSLDTTTGAITGTPTDIGDYSFVVKATGAGGSKLTGTISIKILPTGARITGASTKISLLNAKRFDGTNWQNLKTMKKFDGTNWQNISNE